MNRLGLIREATRAPISRCAFPCLLLGMWLAVFCAAAGASPAVAARVRVKELADIKGVRDNALVGYGIVVGLGGTGDSERVFFTSQSVSGMLGRLGVRIDPAEVRTRNVAAVLVTASLPAFSRAGSRMDVTVSSLGDARSLQGGQLILTPLQAVDGKVYAFAQGPVQVGGYVVSAAGSGVKKNQTTAGRVPDGATVEKSVTPDLSAGPVLLSLRQPDFTTAERVVAAINQELGPNRARAGDPAAIEVSLGDEPSAVVALIAQIERLEVDVDSRARIVVSERTGTLVAGAGVRIRPVAIAHGGLQITVAANAFVSQPGPFSSGETVRVQTAAVDARETAAAVSSLPGTTTIEELVKALNALGLSPRDLIAILQAMKAAGAVDAEIEVI